MKAGETVSTQAILQLLVIRGSILTDCMWSQVTVNLYPELTDFSHTMLDGTKQAAAGDWTVKFG